MRKLIILFLFFALTACGDYENLKERAEEAERKINEGCKIVETAPNEYTCKFQ